jgi:hypothetical protein
MGIEGAERKRGHSRFLSTYLARGRLKEAKRKHECPLFLPGEEILATSLDLEVYFAVVRMAIDCLFERRMTMATVESITAAIAALPPEQVEQVRTWLAERTEADWDTQIERDERAGKLDALAERALAEHRAGRTRPL